MKRIGMVGLCAALLLSATACGDTDTAYDAGMTALQNQNYAKAYELFLESEDDRAAELLKDFVFVPVEKTYVSSSVEEGVTTTYTYDEKGQLIRYETDEQGVVSSCEYGYDADGNLLYVLDEESMSKEQYAYDANGHRVSMVRYKADQELYREEYVYNEAGQMVEQISTAASGTGRTRREYDDAGRCTKVWQGEDENWYEVTVEYDQAGNALKTTTRHSDGSWSESTAQYNDQGKKTHAWYKDKSGTYNEILYEYDADGRCIKERYPHNQMAEYTYDADGNLLSETTILGNRTTYTYDEQGRLLLKVNTPAGEGGIETRVSYIYDEEGRLLSQTTVIGDETTVVSYTYDPYGNPLTYRQTYGVATLEHQFRWEVYYYPNGVCEPVEELLEDFRVVDPLENLSKPPTGLD